MSDTILSSIQRPTRSLPAWATFTSAASAAGTRSQHAQLAGGEKRIRLSVLPSAGWLLGLDYGSFERGGGSTGQALAALCEDIRRAVREEVRRDLSDTGGPVKPEAEYRIGSGQRQRM